MRAIALDANCAWGDLDFSQGWARQLAALWIEFIEQPLPPASDARDVRRFCERASQSPSWLMKAASPWKTLSACATHFAGFNIKLVKCGGLTPALRMARRGRELGLRTMVGCMLESSLLIAAEAVASPNSPITPIWTAHGCWRTTPRRAGRLSGAR